MKMVESGEFNDLLHSFFYVLDLLGEASLWEFEGLGQIKAMYC